MITTTSPNNHHPEVDNWIAFDLEWEPEAENRSSSYNLLPNNTNFTSRSSILPIHDYHKILTFGYEDSHGNKGALDISDFNGYSNSAKPFLEAIKKMQLQYKYCFAWGSKAIKQKNQTNDSPGGINGDLVTLDLNFRHNGISSIVKYDNFSGTPYIKNIDTNTTDIDLLKVFAKPLIKFGIHKNQYKSLKIHEVAVALLG